MNFDEEMKCHINYDADSPWASSKYSGDWELRDGRKLWFKVPQWNTNYIVQFKEDNLEQAILIEPYRRPASVMVPDKDTLKSISSKINPFVQDQLDRLRFCCINKCVDPDNKCQWTLEAKTESNGFRGEKLEVMKDHMRKECPDRLYYCPNKCDDEKQEYHISELEKHLKACPKQLLECSKCKATF